MTSPRVPVPGAAPHDRDGEPFDGDPSWRVTRHMRDGTPITIRPVVPEDREELRRAFNELSPRTRYFRFLAIVSKPSEEMLTHLTCVDQEDHVALAATITSPDLKTERGIGIARFVRLEDSKDVAEAAITVVDDMQHKGVGTALAHELERAARVRGVRTFRAEVLEENDEMRAILEQAGARRLEESSGSGTVAYDVAIPAEPVPKLATTLADALRAVAELMASTVKSFTSEVSRVVDETFESSAPPSSRRDER